MKNFLILLLFLSNLAYAQTSISGSITTNTTWNLANSPYIITGNTVVFGNNTLTIEPGVVVKFNDNVQLRIQGSLIAKGNSISNIIFTSNNVNPKKGSWREINFEYLATFVLDYVQVEYANNALRYNYINTSSNIKNSIFKFNNNAIAVDSGNGQFPITIESVKFMNNDKGIANYHDEVRLKNCEFKNNRIGAELIESNIDSCLFVGNTEIGLDGHTSIIKNSTFTSNNVGLEQSFSGGSDSSIMTKNTIKNNIIGLKITGNNPMATFSNNTICNNSSYNVKSTSTYSGQDLSGNCWCTDDLNEIEKSIFHGIDDISIGVVTFTPTTSGCPDSIINVPPTLSDLYISTVEDTSVNIVLNAEDQDSNEFTYTIVTNALNGSTTLEDDVVNYVPAQNFNGTDSFTVTANDGEFTSNLATVHISVEPVNDSPIANDDSIIINEGESIGVLTNGETSLLYNDTDVENNNLSAVLVSQTNNGKVTLNSDGTFIYEHNGSDTTSDSFSYKINDGYLDSNTSNSKDSSKSCK